MDCKELKAIDLEGSKVTDAGLPFIAEMNKLTALNLLRTRVTAQAAKTLEKELPQCVITWDGNVIDPQ